MNFRLLRLVLTGFILLLFAGACSDATQGKQLEPEKSPVPRGPIVKKPASSFQDTLVIATKAAVFYNPDTLQLEKIRMGNEKVFQNLEHDCFFQMRNARLVLKKYWPAVRIIETSKARYLLFKKQQSIGTIVDLNSKNDICGIYLFDTEKDPELIDMMNVDTALGFYFNN